MNILVLPGDGIGPEITAATLAVLQKANSVFKLGLEFQPEEAGLKTLAKKGTTLPESVMAAARAADGVILGPLIVSFFISRQATGIFKCCTDTYTPSDRKYFFDDDFLIPSKLPPGTPMFRDVNTLTFRQLLRPNQ